MLEIKGNMWNLESEYDAICITTNSVIKANGELVMGKGNALEAVKRYPPLAMLLGKYVKKYGNRAFRIKTSVGNIVSFPTKENWRDNSDIKLIIKSCKELVIMADKFNWNKILLPRPGCGCGGLKWNEVKLELEKYFDDRFTVIS